MHLRNLYRKLNSQNLFVIGNDISQLKTFGGESFKFLFGRGVGDRYYHWKNNLRRSGYTLRIILKMDEEGAACLQDLPWETLHDGEDFIILLPETTEFIRAPILNVSRDSESRVLQPRVLVAISNPIDMPAYHALAIEEELDIFFDLLDAFDGEGGHRIEIVEGASPEKIKLRMAEFRPHIFHFIGHGSFESTRLKSYLLMEEGGQSIAVDADTVVQSLTPAEDLRLVVLNACETGATTPDDAHSGVAWKLIKHGVPAVVSMRTAIANSAAITFSKSFYGSIRRGFSVAAAVAGARRCMAENLKAPAKIFAAPLLYQNTAVPLRLEFQSKKIARKRVLPGVFCIGRESTLGRIRDIAEQAGILGVCVWGPKGVGKTTVLRVAVRRLIKRRRFASGYIINTQHNKSWLLQLETLLRKNPPTVVHLECAEDPVMSPSDVGAALALLRKGDMLFVESGHEFGNRENMASLVLDELDYFSAKTLAKQSGLCPDPKAVAIVLEYAGGNPHLIKTLIRKIKAGDAFDREELRRQYFEAVRSSSFDFVDIQQKGCERLFLEWLSIFIEPVCQTAARDYFCDKMISKEEGMQLSLGEMIKNGWLLTVNGRLDGDVLVPNGMRVALQSLASAQMSVFLHRHAANFFSRKGDETPTLPVMRELIFHYTCSGEKERAWACRMGILDSIRNRSPRKALRECIHLLKEESVLTKEFPAVAAKMQVWCVMGHSLRAIGRERGAFEVYKRTAFLGETALLENNFSESDQRLIQRLLADSLLGMAQFYASHKKEKVMPIAVRALRIFRQEKEFSNVARCQLVLAELMGLYGLMEKRKHLARLAVKNARNSSDYIGLVDALLTLCQIVRSASLDEGIALAEEAFSAAHKSSDYNTVANSCMLLGRLLDDAKRQPDRARALVWEAVKIYEDNENLVASARCEDLLAMMDLGEGQLPSAAMHFCRALVLYRSLNNERVKECVAALRMLLSELQRISKVFLKEHNFALLLEFATAAAHAAEALDCKEELRHAMFNQALAIQGNGDLEGSYKSFEDLLHVAEGESDALMVAECRHEMGICRLKKGDIVAARNLFETSLMDSERLGLGFQAHIHQMLAACLRLDGELEKAQTILESCIAHDRQTRNWVGLTLSLSQAAVGNCDLGRFENAREDAEECLELSKRIHGRHSEMASMLVLGQVMVHSKNPQGASEMFRNALHIAREIGAEEISQLEKMLKDVESEVK